MSRFSSLDAKHTGLMALERQRLEAKISKLRHEVETPPGSGGGRRLERKTPDRKVGSRCHVVFPPRVQAATKQDGPPEPSDASKWRRRLDKEVVLESGAVEDSTPSAPSCEISWLMQMSDQMDKEAEEVKTFLSRHGLDRYIALLAEEGLDSMKALRQVDDAFLQKAGVPDSPRRRLIAAVADCQGGGSSPSTPRGEASEVPNREEWHRFGKAPPGWRNLAAAKARVASTSVSVGAGCEIAVGDDTPLPPEPPAEFEWSRSRPGTASTAQGVDVPYNNRPSLDVVDNEVRLINVDSDAPRRLDVRTSSRAGEASSRPSSRAAGTSTPSTEQQKPKVCCYGCFRQVYQEFAVEVPEAPNSAQAGVRPGSAAKPKLFCGEKCADSFREELTLRTSRERERAERLERKRREEAELLEEQGAAAGQGDASL